VRDAKKPFSAYTRMSEKSPAIFFPPEGAQNKKIQKI
jgi:hypothetical protein